MNVYQIHVYMGELVVILLMVLLVNVLKVQVELFVRLIQMSVGQVHVEMEQLVMIK